jgi:hypothetical protein
MTDWAPKESAMSKERYWLLHLVKLCKKEQSGNMAMTAALQVCAQQGQLHFADLLLE